MKPTVWTFMIVGLFTAAAFVMRPADRVLSERKLDKIVCLAVWRYSPFSLSREAGELVFASAAGQRRKEVRSGFIGDWSGNSLIDWKVVSDAEIQATDRYSGVSAVFKKDGVIVATR